MDLEVGRTYYMVTFADAEQTMPGIKPLIFVGENLLAEENQSNDSFCFQDTVSFQRFGAFTEAEKIEDCYVQEFPKKEIGTSVVDLYRAQEVVAAAVERYRGLGEPKLKVLKSGWFGQDGAKVVPADPEHSGAFCAKRSFLITLVKAASGPGRVKTPQRLTCKDRLEPVTLQAMYGR